MRGLSNFIQIHTPKLVIVLLLTLLNPINPNLTISAQAAYQTGSANFSAAGQYLSAANNSDFNVGTGNFTVEWWQFMNNPPTNGQIYNWPRAWTILSPTHGHFGLSIEPFSNNPQVYFWLNRATLVGNLTNFSTAYQNKWTHFAVTRTSNTVRVFVDGTLLGCASGNTCTNSFDNSHNFTDTTTALSIGSQAGSNGTVFPGLITNFHFVKGTSLYSANFTSPTAPRKSVANTKLLLLNKSSAGLLSDSSGLSKSVTNIGTPPVAYSSSAPAWAADAVIPTLTSASLASDGLSIVLNFSEDLSDLTAVPENFSVVINGSESRVISSLSRSGTNVTLNLAAAISANNSIALTYTDPTPGNDVNALQDEYGNDVATLSNFSVLNALNSSVDSALNLNGTSQYASSPDNDAFDIATTLTLAAWVNPTISSTNMTVAGKAGAYLLQSDGGFWRYCLQGTAAPTSYVCVSTQIPVVTGQWQHVAFTRAANVVNFYLNGYLAFSGSADGAASGNIANSAEPFQVGRFLAQAYFAGLIDEVKLWNVARTQAQIQSDLKSYGGNSSDGLVAYYDFNELVGTRVLNRSAGGSSGLDLITTGAPTISSASIIETSTFQAYTVVKFMRTFLVAANGWTSPASRQLSVLVVGGGGGGGAHVGGGGGGGGVIQSSTVSVTGGANVEVVVGTGGIGARLSTTGCLNPDDPRINGDERNDVTGIYCNEPSNARRSGNGQPSSFANLIANGGGGGGSWNYFYPGSGGSGGGSSNSNAAIPVGAGTVGQGNRGGSHASTFATGGGGGAGGVGETGTASTNKAGDGGVGITSTITGQNLQVGGGGGGGQHDAFVAGTGSFGGGSGRARTSVKAFSGSPNTGGGGGGSGNTSAQTSEGGDGGSGIVVIRYITNLPTILTQPTNDTTTVGTVDTFTISTSIAPTPLTKSVQWQFTSDTTTAVVANITGWTNLSIPTGTGFTTDTFTTVAVTKSMNKFRYRAIVTFSDTATISVQETSTVAVLTVNDAITFTSDTSTITRKYGGTPAVRPIAYIGGTTNTGAVGTATSHTVRGQVGSQASGRIVLDTSTSTAVFRVDTRTVVGSYVETITVTDARGATATYTQRVVVTQADTLTVQTVQADTLTAITFGGTLSPTATVTGLVPGDAVSSTTFGHISCANGGRCAVGDIGPGGGVIFLEITNSSDSQTAITGYTSGGIYLEAAPVGWGNGISVAAGETTGTSYLDPVVKWCNTTGNTGATQVGVGQGANNTRLGDIGCTSGAVQIAADWISPNGLNDWYLPSQNELEQMGLQKNLVGLIYGLTNCKGNTTCYWSSTEVGGGSSSRVLRVNEGTNTLDSSEKLSASDQVMIRPIRAFSPRAIGQETVTAGAPTAAGTYTLRPTAITLAEGVNTNNYVFVDYRSSSVTINRATQSPRISMQPASVAYDTGTATQALTATSGPGTGAVFYLIGAGSAATCSISGSTVRISADGVCNVVAYKQASTNYLADSATAVVITFTRFIPRPVQVQLYPSMIPLNQGNALETTTLTVSTLTISSVTKTGAGAYTIGGTGFSDIEVIRIGGTNLTGSNYSVGGVNSITLTGVSAFTGPLFIRKTDGQEAVFFQFDWS